MFGLFKKKIKTTHVLLNYDYNWVMSQAFLSYLINYLGEHKLDVSNYIYDNYQYKTSQGKVSKLKLDKASDIISISFFNGEQSEDSNIIVNISLGKPSSFNYISIELQNSVFFNFEKFIQDFLITDSFKPVYGFVYQGNGIHSYKYLYGLRENINDLININKKSQKDYDKWRNENKKVEEGFIRDVYSLNVLNAEHLKMIKIDGKSLEELITSDSRYGELKRIQENYLWLVDEKDLQWVRNQCYPGKFIL